MAAGESFGYAGWSPLCTALRAITPRLQRMRRARLGQPRQGRALLACGLVVAALLVAGLGFLSDPLPVETLRVGVADALRWSGERSLRLAGFLVPARAPTGPAGPDREQVTRAALPPSAAIPLSPLADFLRARRESLEFLLPGTTSARVDPDAERDSLVRSLRELMGPVGEVPPSEEFAELCEAFVRIDGGRRHITARTDRDAALGLLQEVVSLRLEGRFAELLAPVDSIAAAREAWQRFGAARDATEKLLRVLLGPADGGSARRTGNPYAALGTVQLADALDGFTVPLPDGGRIQVVPLTWLQHHARTGAQPPSGARWLDPVVRDGDERLQDPLGEELRARGARLPTAAELARFVADWDAGPPPWEWGSPGHFRFREVLAVDDGWSSRGLRPVVRAVFP